MLLNIVGFNIAWFGLVLIGDRFIPVVLLLLGLHLFYCKKRRAEFKLIVIVTFIGTMVDSTLFFFDVFLFNEYRFIPFWLIMLWAAFAATIAHSLKFLAGSKVIQFYVGYIFPPLSYLVGVPHCHLLSWGIAN
ncbi:DUF2878 domain-containing protein [Colwellia sp. MSW7]|uniref:DUF2878 domain-containing protein n=1 Tax=Colwellia maritima TaxID=2912588 RepID=A0ABS9X9W4_9GAMM|nr:DUF2878 domain-containing protein [Colwellia maritima]MCI2285842.1 DUF2878 domain-containing protein [Colwellia maritima]